MAAANPSKKRKQPRPILLVPQTQTAKSSSKIDDLVRKYGEIFSIYPDYDFMKLYDIDLPTSDRYQSIGTGDFLTRGNTKMVKKSVIAGKNYAVVVQPLANFIDEYETHLELLDLYHRTRDRYRWNFTIPKIYPNKNGVYVMDLINICDSKKSGLKRSDAKKSYKFPVPLQKEIGQFLGLACLHYNKLINDFEIYLENCDTPHQRFIVLDFGVYYNITSAPTSVLTIYEDIIFENIIKECTDEAKRALIHRIAMGQSITRSLSSPLQSAGGARRKYI